MLVFRHLDDIPKSRLPTHLAQYIEKLLTSITASLKHYDPEDDGHVILITPTDNDSNLCERIGLRWSDSMFEGVSINKGFHCYHAVIQHNNQFTVSIIVPAEPWLDPAIKERIHRELA